MIRVLDLIIVLLILVMICVGQSAGFYKSLADKRSFSQEPDMMSFELKNNDYVGLIRGKYINEFNGDMEAAAYHSLADYTEAAFLYRIYDSKGYTEKADLQKTVMNDDRVNMKELTVFADKVDKMLSKP